MRAAAGAGVLALGVLADRSTQSIVALPLPRAGSSTPGSTRVGPHVGVLVEALADRQAQAPERDVVGHVGRADRAEEDGVEGLQLLEAALGDVGAVLQVAVRAPVEVLDLEREAAVLRASACSTSRPAAITSVPMPSPRNRGDLVLRQGCSSPSIGMPEPGGRQTAGPALTRQCRSGCARGRARDRPLALGQDRLARGLDNQTALPSMAGLFGPCSAHGSKAKPGDATSLPQVHRSPAMSAPPEAKGEPITDKRQLVEYLEQGCKPRADWRIGTEHEKFGFTHDDLRPLPYDGAARHPRRCSTGLADGSAGSRCSRSGQPIALAKRRRCNISLEPGGQFELSRRAARDPAPDLLRGAHAISTRCKKVAEPARHRHARPRLPAQVAARGHAAGCPRAATRSCGAYMPQGRQARPRHDAAHLHRAGEPRLRVRGRHGAASSASAWRCSRSPPRCSPTRRSSRASPTASSAIAATSGPTPTRTAPACCRSCSRPASASSATSTTRSTCRCTSSTATAATSTPAASRSATSWPASCRRCRASGRRISDWADHLTTAFPEVRLKRFLEMRGADGGPWRRALRACRRCGSGCSTTDAALDAAWELVQGLDARGARAAARRGAEARR